MLLTKASEYAVLAIDSISKSEKPMGATLIAENIGISKSFLAKILQNLARDNILISYKGINGGFALARPLYQISILEVIHAVEEKPANVFECSNDLHDCPSHKATECRLWPFLNRLQSKVDTFLQNISLEEILKS